MVSPRHPVEARSASPGARLRAHSASYLVARAVPGALGVLTVPIFLRLLGAREFGTWALLMAVVLFLGNAASTWIGHAVLRFREGREADGSFRDSVRSGTLLSALAGGLLAFPLLGLTLLSLPEALLAAVATASHIRYSVAFSSAQSGLRRRRVMAGETVRAIFQFGAPVPLLFLMAEPSWVPLLAGFVVGTLLGTRVLEGRQGASSTDVGDSPATAPSAPPTTRLTELWGYGAPLSLWMGLSVLLNFVDRFLVEAFLGREEVGLYAGVYDVVFKGSTLLLAPVVMAAHPLIMNAWNRDDREGARAMLRSALLLALGAGIGLGVAWGLAAAPVTRFIVGGDPAELAGLVLPLAVGAALWQAAMLSHKPLELAGRTGAMVVRLVVALGVNVAANVVLLPRMGVTGAAWSTLLSALVYLALTRVPDRAGAAT